MCGDSTRRRKSPSMSAIPQAHIEWSGEDEELYHDCESTKGNTVDQQEPEECSRMLFFARCPPSLPQGELLQLFGRFGHITGFNLYRRWAKAKNSKGCGTVVYTDKASAAAAVAALNGKQSWPESESPMVVEWAQPSKLRLAGRSDDAAAGTPPGSDAPNTKTPTAAGNHTSAAANTATTTSSGMHKADQQLPRLPHCSATGSSASTLSASQRLVQESLTLQAANLDCHSSHTACSPLSEHEAQCTMPSHVVPMLGSLMLDLPPAVHGTATGNQHTSTPGNLMRSPCPWSDRDSAALLPQLCPPLGMLPGGCGSNDHQSSSAEQACQFNSFNLASLSNCSNIWSNPSNAASAAMPNALMHDNALLLQQQQARSAAAAAAAATAAMQSMSGPLLQASASAAAVAAAAAAPFYSTSCLWPCEDRSANLFYRAEHAYDSVACTGSFAAAATAAATAAAAGSHSNTLLPQSGNSGNLPSLLEVIPAMSWLQLQQIDQQNAVNAAAAAAAAVAADPTGSMSSTFVGADSGSCNAGRHITAAQAAASMQEVNLDLNPHAARVLVGSLDFVTCRSGADVSVNSTTKGLQLRLRGSPAQIESACATLLLL